MLGKLKLIFRINVRRNLLSRFKCYSYYLRPFKLKHIAGNIFILLSVKNISFFGRFPKNTSNNSIDRR